MPNLINLIGKQYKMLTVISRSDNVGRYVSWNCLCVCGNQKKVQSRFLSNGKVTNCGCRKEKEKDIIAGRRFGRLTAIKNTERKYRRTFIWECLCDCGNTCYVPRPWLTTNNNRSCGCLKKESLEKMWERNRKEYCYSDTKEYKRLHAEMRRKDPKVRLHSSISSNIKLALKKRSIRKQSKTFDMLGYSIEEYIIHIEKQFTAGMNWSNYGKWHIDHIVPISTAQTLDDVISLNQLSNLRPLWAKDNLKKHSKRTHLI